jgi:hypothetical protein
VTSEASCSDFRAVETNSRSVWRGFSEGDHWLPWDRTLTSVASNTDFRESVSRFVSE